MFLIDTFSKIHHKIKSKKHRNTVGADQCVCPYWHTKISIIFNRYSVSIPFISGQVVIPTLLGNE